VKEEAHSWHVYVVRTADDRLYTGVATDVERRLAEHAGAGARGAKFLRGRGPLELLFRCEIGDRALAQRVEYGIKQLSRAEKEAMVLRSPGRTELLEQLDLEFA